MKKTKIAVVGSGISGLSCAWLLLTKNYTIDLFEKNYYFGGHTNTQTITVNNKNLNVDTGFIVFNDLNYTNLCKFFDSLNVKSYESDMSFGVSINRANLEYSGSNLSTIFAQKKNIVNINFLNMLVEVFRFNRNAEKDKEKYPDHTIEDYLQTKKYSEYFKYNHLYPMAASIWSSSLDNIKGYPFSRFIDFFSNHGLLKIFNRPKWRTVLNGSRTYVDEVLKLKNLNKFKNCSPRVTKISDKKIYLSFNGKTRQYDHLIIAVHSDQVKDLIKLDKATQNLFLQINYKKNIVYLHSDESLMPKLKKVWSSWNYLDNGEKENDLTVTYWMNKLQKINTKKNIFVSLNPSRHPEKKKIFKKINYEHPIFNFKTFKNQKKIEALQGKKNIWFCGAYLGYGFHEDGIKSGLKVARKILQLDKYVKD